MSSKGPSSQASGKRPPSAPPPRPTKAGARPGRPAGRTRREVVAEQRKRRRLLLAGGVTALVVVIVAVFVVVKLTGGSAHKLASTVPASHDGSTSAGTSGGLGTPVPSFVYSGFSGVTPATLAAAAKNASVPELADPTVTNDPPISTPKPTVLYIGAEFCPYCATERWAMVLALSQFGTFHHLTSIRSMPDDSSGYDNIPTFSFYKSTYTSPYLTFTPVETETVDLKPLQTPTKAEQAIFSKYDSGESIPFVDMNGKAIIIGAEYDPALLRSGDFLQDARSIIGGTSTLATSVYANAGGIVSDLCRMTGGKPGSVCHLFPKPITR